MDLLSRGRLLYFLVCVCVCVCVCARARVCCWRPCGVTHHLNACNTCTDTRHAKGTSSSAPAATETATISIVKRGFKVPGGSAGAGAGGGGSRNLKPSNPRRSKPLHNPNSYGAVVLPKPPASSTPTAQCSTPNAQRSELRSVPLCFLCANQPRHSQF